MKFTRFLAILLILAWTITSFATPVKRNFRDMKLPTQVMLEKQTFTAPSSASAAAAWVAIDGPSSASAVAITSFVAQPDIPRNLIIQPTGTTTDVENCSIVITGTDFNGDTLTETIAITANQSASSTANFAFKSLVSVAFPDNCESGTFATTWQLGYQDKFGLKRCMDYAGHVFHGTADGVYEATRPTVSASTTAIHANTVDFNTAADGSKDFEAFFIQNFRCFP